MYILFDIGGTKMRLALSRDGKTFDEPVKIPTPKEFEEGISEFVRIAKELSGGRKIHGIAGGIAGPLNRQKTHLVKSPNLSGWVNMPLHEELLSALGAPVVIENDSAVVGLGEAHHGAGKGNEIMVYITVSTGVGGARIVNGKIDANRYGFEIGHQVIDLTGEGCVTCHIPAEHGNIGHLDEYVSGRAFEKRFGIKPYEVKEEKVWNETAKILSFGVYNSILHWSPDIVVLGGSMMVGNPKIPTPLVEQHTHEILTIFPEKPKIVEATLGDFGGIYGALELVRQRFIHHHPRI